MTELIRGDAMNTDSDLRTIHWQVSFACNLRCRYCWNETRAVEVAGIGERRAGELMDEIAVHPGNQVLFTGGEPFLVPWIEAVLEHGLARGVPISIFTNGTLLTEERTRNLMRIARRGRFMLIVSLDALRPDANEVCRGATRQVVEAIDRLDALGATRAFPVMMNSVLTVHTIDEAEDLLAFATARHLREHRLDIGILFPRDQYPPDLDLGQLPREELSRKLDRLLATLDRYRDRIRLLPAEYYLAMKGYLETGRPFASPCGASTRLLVIGPDGQVRPCFERGPILADLREDSLHRALERAVEPGLEEAILRQECLSPRCLCSFIFYPHRVG